MQILKTLEWLKATGITHIVNVAHGTGPNLYSANEELLKGTENSFNINFLSFFKNLKKNV
jgi:hypothetical protein